MVDERHFSARIESDYERRYLSYYKFRLRVYICSFLCFLGVSFIVASLIIQVFNSSVIFPKSYELAEGDMRIITVSTTFCEGISVKPSKLTRTLRIVSEVSMAKEKRVSNITLDVLIPHRKYWYKSYYLLKGSSIEIEASSDSFLQLLIFKGRPNLDGWIDKQTRQHATKISKGNPNKRTQISYVYQITQEGNYYILFQHVSGDSRVPKLSVVLSVTRQLYDISSAVSSCNAAFEKTCYARLLFNSNEKTLLEVSGSSKYLYMNNLPTTWYCQPRIWFFLVVFGGGFVFCITFGLVVYVLLTNRKTEGFRVGPRKHSVNTQSSGSSRAGGSLKCKHVKEGSIQTVPGRTSSLRSQRNRPLSVNGTLGRHKQETSLPTVVPQIYRGDSEHEEDGVKSVNQESVPPPQSLQHANSLENISIASFDTTMSLPITFSTFKKRLFDEETASCHSFDVDSSLRRHRNRHHPRFQQELKKDRDIISARCRARFEAQERRENLKSHQSDSHLYQQNRSLTFPKRFSPDPHAGLDFYRDLDLTRQPERERRSRQSDSQLNYDQNIMTLPGERRAKRNFYRDLELARTNERARSHESDSQLNYDQKIMTLPRERRAKRNFYRDLELARHPEREPLLSQESDSQLEQKNLTLPRPPRERCAKRDFYRDLELASKRDINHNNTCKDNILHGHLHGSDSNYERQCERILERIDQNPKQRKAVQNNSENDDSDQLSIGDQLDRIADEDRPKRVATLPRSHKTSSNGYPPQMIKAKPVGHDNENHLVVVAQALPVVEVRTDKKAKKDKASNKKDIKLRNHSSRRKENFWKPRLSIVSEV